MEVFIANGVFVGVSIVVIVRDSSLPIDDTSWAFTESVGEQRLISVSLITHADEFIYVGEDIEKLFGN